MIVLGCGVVVISTALIVTVGFQVGLQEGPYMHIRTRDNVNLSLLQIPVTPFGRIVLMGLSSHPSVFLCCCCYYCL